VDCEGCSLVQHCPCYRNEPSWNSKKEYVNCIKMYAPLTLSQTEVAAAVDAADKSKCGKTPKIPIEPHKKRYQRLL
jgi:hypothetical protein